MAIRRMISRDPAEFRAFQTRMAEVGRIRIGQFVTPEGKKGRPVKLDRFRLTSPTEQHIQAAAEEYGGEVRPYQPQGGGVRQWEVITDANALNVHIVNGQLIDPVYEMWGAGRTCVRRCDGEWNAQMREPCLCNDPERRPTDPRQLCKVTTRVNVMLPEVAGLHAWRLETHSENAAVEMGAPAVAGLVRVARVPVPATLYLRKEMRRERNHEEQKFDTKDFYVPTFYIPLSALALAAGAEAVTAALTAAGAPALLSSDRPAIEAAPMSAPPAPSAPPAGPAVASLAPWPPLAEDDPQGGATVSAEEHGRILVAVEKADSIETLDVLRDAMKARNVRYKRVQDAWVSKRAAVMQAAAMRLDEMARQDPDGFAAALDAVSPETRDELRRRMAAHDDRAVFEAAAREQSDEIELEARANGAGPCLDPYCANGPAPCGYTPNQHMEAHGATAILEADRERFTEPTVFEDAEREYTVDDAVSALGAEVIHETQRQQDATDGAIEGTVEDGPGAGVPQVPAGDYTVAAEWPQLMAVAGKFDPPLTTDQVSRRMRATFALGHVGEATGEQLARMRAALEAELSRPAG